MQTFTFYLMQNARKLQIQNVKGYIKKLLNELRKLLNEYKELPLKG